MVAPYTTTMLWGARVLLCRARADGLLSCYDKDILYDRLGTLQRETQLNTGLVLFFPMSKLAETHHDPCSTPVDLLLELLMMLLIFRICLLGFFERTGCKGGRRGANAFFCWGEMEIHWHDDGLEMRMPDDNTGNPYGQDDCCSGI